MARTLNQQCTQQTECIACAKSNLTEILDLGVQPLANSFKKSKEDAENKYPLKLNVCCDCYHLQLSHLVHPDELFKHYLYVSGTAKTQLDYFDWFSKMVLEKIGISNPRVLDIGCNDGSQLDYFKSKGFQTTGIDPAENLHPISSKKHNVICDYFNDDRVSFSEKFDVVVCQNAFAHNYDQFQFLQKCNNILSDEGMIFITISQAKMVVNNEFDTVYHEHYSYYNVRSMNEICRRAGVFLNDVLTHPIHGTSYIFVISRKENQSANIQRLMEEEQESGLYGLQRYKNYSVSAHKIANDFRVQVQSLKQKGFTVIGYGSPAKGNTMLNFSGVTLDFIVDDNPMKQNMYTPGSSISIYGSDRLNAYAESDTVCFVPLAWNFFGEISKKISEKRKQRVTSYLKYFPAVEIIVV